MIPYIVLGILQGLFEWLPVSSEGLSVLAQNYFFDGQTLSQMIHVALFLHLGTFLAALVYFWGDVVEIFKTIFRWKESDAPKKNVVSFLILSGVLSGLLGYLFLKLITSFEETVLLAGQGLLLVIGILLLITAWLQFRAKRGGERREENITTQDSLLLGLAQGLSILPGLSRSGLTMAALLLKKFNEQTALRLSFLMSLPAVLGANIVLQLDTFLWSKELAAGLIASFVFGLITIHGLLLLAKKTNFGLIVLIFGLLTIASVFV